MPPDFDSVLGKIRSLAESGLTSLHVLGDFLKRRIAPLKQRPRPAWSFTGLNDCSRTHRGEGSDLTQEALEVLVRAVTGEVFVPEHLILPQGVVPLCEDSRLRTAVLATLPTLDDGGLAARQTGGDPDRGLRIPDASVDQAGHGRQCCHERSQPGPEQLRRVVGRSRPAQVTQGRRDPSHGARCEASEDRWGRGPG